MKEFFRDTEFGQRLKNVVRKTSQQKHGQTIYEVTCDLREYGLRKGDKLYLDGMHKNHLEVYRKNCSFKTILNLDGSENKEKALRAAGRSCND